MIKHSFLIFMISLFFCFSCNKKTSKLITYVPDEIFILQKFPSKDTITIRDKEQISSIVEYMNNGEVSRSKFSGSHILDFPGDSTHSFNRLIVRKNRFKYLNHNYILDSDFEKLIDKIIESNSSHK